jgi:beta-galactosidase
MPEVAPAASVEIRIEGLDVPELLPGEECFLTFHVLTLKDKPWAAAGHEVGWEQFAMPFSAPAACPESPEGTLTVKDGKDGKVQVIGRHFVLNVDKKAAQITGYSWQNKALILSGPQLNLWRAVTDNDGVKTWDSQPTKALGRWLKAGLNALRCTRCECEVQALDDSTAVVELYHEWTGAEPEAVAAHRHRYVITGDGAISVENLVQIPSAFPDLPRVGVTMTLAPALEKLTWFGRGPHESYCDRKAGAPVGVYQSTVAEQHVPYIGPQENGNKTDVRWLALEAGERDAALLYQAENRLLECSVSHFTADDLYKAFHDVELEPRSEVILNIDFGQRGLGGASCGPDALQKYRLEPGVYSFSYSIHPYTAEEDN